MNYRSFLPTQDFPLLKPFFTGNLQKKKLVILQLFLEKLNSTFGFEFGISFPEYLREHDPSAWDAFAAFERLKALGIVKSLSHNVYMYPDEPKGHFTFVGLNVDKLALGHSGVGRDMFNRSQTLWPAVGEALERWALFQYYINVNKYIDSSYKALKENKIDIFSACGFTNELREKGHPDVDLLYDENSIFRWVKGYSLTDSKVMHIPLQWVSIIPPKVLKEKKEPLLSPAMSTGVAAGQTLGDALLNGLLEVVERDAFMIHWLNKISSDVIDLKTIPDPDGKFKHILDTAHRYKLEIFPLYLKTDVPVHTVLTLIIDRSGIGPAVMVGARSGFSFPEVVYSSVNEKLISRSSMRKMMEDEPNTSPSDSFGMNHKERMLYWCQKEKIKDIQFWLKGKVKSYKEFPNYNVFDGPGEQLENFLIFFKENNYQVVYKEILPKKIKRKLGGLTVAMVRVPQFQPLHLKESLPAFEGKRLQEIPGKIGFQSLKKVNTDPHPFP